MKIIGTIIFSIFSIQYLIYTCTLSYKKSFLTQREKIDLYLSYKINGIYLTTNRQPYPDHTSINLDKKSFNQIKKFARNYIIIDNEIKKSFSQDIELKSPMDYIMISNIDLDQNIELLFYNKNHPNIILEITPEGYITLEKNNFSKMILNLISWGGPLRRQIFHAILP